MKKRIIVGIFALVLALLVTGSGWAAPSPMMEQAQTGKQQVACPVLGGPINKSVSADFQGKRVYFCCSGCTGTFKGNPQKYLKKMEEQGITPEKAPGGK